jgi:hypothetical protein
LSVAALSVLALLSAARVGGAAGADDLLRARGAASPSCVRPLAIPREGLDGTFDTPHFRIHYARSGPDRIPSWPDSSILDTLGSYFERAWRRFHVEMGFRVPPGDESYGGGWNLVDCYLRRLPASGVAKPIRVKEEPYGDCPESWFGELGLDICGAGPAG